MARDHLRQYIMLTLARIALAPQASAGFAPGPLSLSLSLPLARAAFVERVRPPNPCAHRAKLPCVVCIGVKPLVV